MNSYQRAILNGRKKFLKLNKKQELELLKIYIELANQLKNDIESTKTDSSEQYLKELNKIVEMNIINLNIKLNNIIKQNIEISSQISSLVSLAYYENITEDIKLKMMFTNLVTTTSANTVKKLIQGNYYADGKTLDHRIWNITNKNAKDIDILIKTNISRGANAKKLSQQLDKYINPMKKMETKTLDAGLNKSISYQAQRLARTSITHSFAETTIENAKNNPFNKGIKWNLSTSHYERQVKRYGLDICDDYNGRIFNPSDIPLQHPNCLCYFTEENEDIDIVIKELNKWCNGEINPELEQQLENLGIDFKIEKKQSKNIEKLSIPMNANSVIIDNNKWLESNFSSDKRFNKHIEKHGHEYGNITGKEYLQIARNLLASKLNDDIEGFVSKDGFVFKYKKSTNDFAIGREDGNISTLFRPKDGYNYWLEQIKNYKEED